MDARQAAGHSWHPATIGFKVWWVTCPRHTVDRAWRRVCEGFCRGMPDALLSEAVILLWWDWQDREVSHMYSKPVTLQAAPGATGNRKALNPKPQNHATRRLKASESQGRAATEHKSRESLKEKVRPSACLRPMRSLERRVLIKGWDITKPCDKTVLYVFFLNCGF